MILKIICCGRKLIIISSFSRILTEGLIRTLLTVMPNTNVKMSASASSNDLAHSSAACKISISIALLSHHSIISPLIYTGSIILKIVLIGNSLYRFVIIILISNLICSASNRRIWAIKFSILCSICTK